MMNNKPLTKSSATRAHILSTASQLFYRHGIRAVGVDTIIAESGVAKMTLYKHFKSKDELILAFLEHWGQQWQQAGQEILDTAQTPDAKMLAFFDVLLEKSASPEFRGCAFINTATELANPATAIHELVAKTKWGMKTYLAQIAGEAGYENPEQLATRIFILFEGAIVCAWIQQNPALIQEARAAAEQWLAQTPRR